MLWFLWACTNRENPITTKMGMIDSWGQVGAMRTAKASSSFREGELEYTAHLVADGISKSAWCASKSDMEPWVRMSSDCGAPLLGLVFRNGFAESPIMFSQRDRVRRAHIMLDVDGNRIWEKEVILEDSMYPQYIVLDEIPCIQKYTLQINLLERYQDTGPICFSEMEAMVSSDIPIEIIKGTAEEGREVPARTNLDVYAGPSYEYTHIGIAPILLTQYGTPFLRIVESRGDFVRFDRLRRRFAPHETPPEEKYPTLGGWVHKTQLDWDQAYPISP